MPVEPLLAPEVKTATVLLMARLSIDAKTGIPPGKTEWIMVIFDKERNLLLAERGESSLNDYDQKILFPYLTAFLPPGEYEFRIVARDMETGEAAVGKSLFQIRSLLWK
jgi:hypothetical protein